ncbi:septation protein A [Pelistega sp. MC2]|uniref:septation protein A n=1 Tax=Pelistega sp. MC2 TaxID=1720297 RepID=UPI0008D994CE|nr:septation protein A [Pelistega sp. MC2]
MKKLLFDFLPLVLFFIALKVGDIYLATWVAIGAAIAQIIWLKLTNKNIEGSTWLSLFIIVIFGGATIYLKDETFIKWKPTVLYWLFGLILIFGKLLFNKNYIQTLMKSQITMPEIAWTKMNYSWAIFFIIVGLLNLYVAFSGHFTTDQWGTFKVFGTTILLIIFAVGQSLWLNKYMQIPDSSQKG